MMYTRPCPLRRRTLSPVELTAKSLNPPARPMAALLSMALCAAAQAQDAVARQTLGRGEGVPWRVRRRGLPPRQAAGDGGPLLIGVALVLVVARRRRRAAA